MVGVEATVGLTWVNNADLPRRDRVDRAICKANVGDVRVHLGSSQGVVSPKDGSDYHKLRQLYPFRSTAQESMNPVRSCLTCVGLKKPVFIMASPVPSARIGYAVVWNRQ